MSIWVTGPEVHSHIDEGLFRRLGLPEELIATSYEAYIRAVLRLVEEHDWREILQHRLLDNDVEQVLFEGYPEKFAAVTRGRYCLHYPRNNETSGDGAGSALL
ncbi:hypothetical protein V9986_004116 [Salmonella enterica]|nr:hypothetical protein [Salmonella enterica subsp. enterica]